MKYINQYENFFTDLFKKKPIPKPSIGQKGQGLRLIKYKYTIGDIVKLIFKDRIGEVVKQSYAYNDTNDFARDPIPIYILDIDDKDTIHEEDELTNPTPEELEFYLNTKKYNL